MQPTLVFLPGESCGQRSLASCSSQGCTESDTTEATQHAHTETLSLLPGITVGLWLQSLSSQVHIGYKGLISAIKVGSMRVCSVVSDSVTPRTVACQAPLSMGFPRQEYRNGLPFPTPGDLPDPGIELLHLLHRQADSLPLHHPGSLKQEEKELISLLNGSVTNEDWEEGLFLISWGKMGQETEQREQMK